MKLLAVLVPLVPLLFPACTEIAEPAPSALPAQGTTHVHTMDGILEVDYVREGNRVVFQDDMTVPIDEFMAAMIDPADLDEAIAGGAERAAVRAIGRYRWPGGRIPFRFAAGLDQPHRDIVNAAIAHWQANTPFRFVARTSESDYVTFVLGNNDGACRSDVGRSGGEQEIEVDSCDSNAIIHEIGHCVGFYHEQTRYDRDSFVTINWQNIITTPTDRTNNFKRYVDLGRDGADAGDYDYGSIMHYRTDQFGINGAITIQPPPGITLGSSAGLSRGDIDAAWRLFSPGGTLDSGPKVTLYRDASFAGINQSYGLGYHSAVGGDFATVGDNTTSSIYIPPGMVVEAWIAGVDEPHTYFGGSQATLPSPYDNAISAIAVTRGVTAYRESSQWGVSQTFRIGEWKANLNQMTIVGNDQISSLYVPPGLVAELCTTEAGTVCQTFEGGVNYVGDALNDKTSMIRVKAAVTLFQEGNLWGNRKSLTVGTYTSGSFAPVQNEALSSLVVGDSLKATVCDTSSGGGTCEVFRGDVNYVGAALNDQASWIKIETNTLP